MYLYGRTFDIYKLQHYLQFLIPTWVPENFRLCSLALFRTKQAQNGTPVSYFVQHSVIFIKTTIFGVLCSVNFLARKYDSSKEDVQYL